MEMGHRHCCETKPAPQCGHGCLGQNPSSLVCLFLVLETESLYFVALDVLALSSIDQAGVKFTEVHLPLSASCQNERYALPHPAYV